MTSTAPLRRSSLGPLVIESVDPAAMRALAVILGDPNPLHLDPAAVRAAGLGDRVINQGPANFGYVLTMLRDAAPDGAVRDLTVRLMANVFAGDRVTAAGRFEDAPGRPKMLPGDGTYLVWLDIDGGGRAIDGRARLGQPGVRAPEVRQPDPQTATGQPIPVGSTVIEPHEQDALEALLQSGRNSPAAPGDVAHPVWAMICAMRGQGQTVDELFTMLDCPMDSGPMLGEVSIQFHAPLRVGETYAVTGTILSVTRKQGGRMGPFDLARTMFHLTTSGTPVADVAMNFVLPRPGQQQDSSRQRRSEQSP